MKKVIFLLIAVIAFAGGMVLQSADSGSPSELADIHDVLGRSVKVASVRDLSTTQAPLPLLGTVKSVAEVTLHAEAQGEITGVYVSLGQFVPAGTVVVELKNTAQRAAVAQAEAAVDAARANLLKLRSGVRDEQLTILESKLANAEAGLSEANVSSLNTMTSAFVFADDAIRGKIDQLFNGAKSAQPKFIFMVADKEQIEWDRLIIETSLNAWDQLLNELSVDGDIAGAFDVAEENVKRIKSFLTTIARVVNVLSPSAERSQTQIEALKSAVLAARSSVINAGAALSNARDGLNARIFALDVAREELGQAETGSRSEDLAAADAAVRQAEAGLAGARANLSNTLVVTPISGTVGLLSVARSDFVSFFDPVALIFNKTALEVVTFITEDDHDSVRVGADVLVDGRLHGVVASVARALDSRTKKIEVKVAVDDPRSTLVNGQSVALDVTRTLSGAHGIDTFIIPISALKISAEGSRVLTVGEENKLIAHPVVQGAIIDRRIIIRQGLTPDMTIVLDARGLKEGDVVSVEQ